MDERHSPAAAIAKSWRPDHGERRPEDHPVRYWTTRERPAQEQFSYWREVICEAFTPLATDRTPAHCATGPGEPGLTSWVRSSPLSSINCAELSSRTQLITHGAAEVRRTVSDQVFVNLQLRGRCIAKQGGRTCVVPAGSFAVFDTTSEYFLEYFEDAQAQEWRVLSFRVPRSMVVPLVAEPDKFTAVTHSGRVGGFGNLVASTMLSIWSGLDEFTAAEMESAETSYTAILTAAAGTGGPARESSRETVDRVLRASINRYLAANILTGADLSAASVARKFNISVRKLHGLYSDCEFPFGKTVMKLRVEGCARELASGANEGSLTHLAARWGFCDLSHLNRVFRANFDCSPSEYRALARIDR